jgi:hypothetical protein
VFAVAPPWLAQIPAFAQHRSFVPHSAVADAVSLAAVESKKQYKPVAAVQTGSPPSRVAESAAHVHSAALAVKPSEFPHSAARAEYWQYTFVVVTPSAAIVTLSSSQ